MYYLIVFIKSTPNFIFFYYLLVGLIAYFLCLKSFYYRIINMFYCPNPKVSIIKSASAPYIQ